MKTCTKCETSKPLSEFQKRAASKDGRASFCTLCKREYDNAHYAANPDRRSYIRQNSDKRIEKAREWILQYLVSHPCVDCGEKDIVVLEFDHRGDKEFNISTMIRSHPLNKLKTEVEKCDVRCANCHRRKTAKDFDWWKYAAFA